MGFNSAFKGLMLVAWHQGSTLYSTHAYVFALSLYLKGNLNENRKFVLYSDVNRSQLKPAIRRKRGGLLSSGVSAAWQRLTSHSPPYRETDSGFRIRGVFTPSAKFARSGTQRFSSLLVSKRSSPWALHFRSDEEVKEGVYVWLAREP